MKFKLFLVGLIFFKFSFGGEKTPAEISANRAKFKPLMYGSVSKEEFEKLQELATAANLGFQADDAEFSLQGRYDLGKWYQGGYSAESHSFCVKLAMAEISNLAAKK